MKTIRRYGILSLFVCLGLGCSSEKSDSTESKKAPRDTAPTTIPATVPAEKPVEKSAEKPKERPMHTIKLEKIATSKPLLIDVPDGFKIEQATPDYVKLNGPTFGILIELPAEGIVGLDDERRLLEKPTIKPLLDETLADGEALAYIADGEHIAIVARPKLGVLCSGAKLKSETDARQVVEICKSLRA